MRCLGSTDLWSLPMNFFGTPSHDMNEFSQEFGGIAPNQLIVGDPGRAGAHHLIAEFGSHYGAARNKNGQVINLEAQVFFDQIQNAICALPNQVLFIGYNEGMKALIAEVALATVLLRISRKEFSSRRELFQFLGLRRCHSIGRGNPWNPEKWNSLASSINRRSSIHRDAIVLENYLLLFLMLHELMHGILGHAHVLAAGHMHLYLGETESRVTSPDHRWGLLAEIHADHAAFNSLVKTLVVTDHCIVFPSNKMTVPKIFEHFVAGICLLLSCWFVIANCDNGIDFYATKPGQFDHAAIFDGAHLPEPDRLALLFATTREEDRHDDTLTRAFSAGLDDARVRAFKFVVDTIWPAVPECYAAYQMISHYGLYGGRASELLGDIRGTDFFQEFRTACNAYTFDARA
jgi:hypothetical protein